MKVTLQDIAESTGYSLSTISRVLNGSDKYAEETRNVILETARKLDYAGIRVKNTLQPKKYLNIALLTDFHEGEFYASYFSGYVKAATSKDIRISLISLLDPHEMIREYIGLLSDQYYDGAILFVPELNRSDYEAVLEDIPDGFPIVSNALIESPVLTTITFDGYSGGHLAASHLWQRKYKNVGIIKGPFNKAESRFRFNGFADFVTQNPDMELVFTYDGDFNFGSGVEAFTAYLKSEVKPRAVFISNDLMCHGFVEAAKSNGLRIPEDIAVLGYDDLPMCVHTHPTLSSVKTDFVALAEASLQRLVERHKNPDLSGGMLTLIPVSLESREST